MVSAHLDQNVIDRSFYRGNGKLFFSLIANCLGDCLELRIGHGVLVGILLASAKMGQARTPELRETTAMTVSLSELLGIITILITVGGLHIRLEQRLTRIETKHDEKMGGWETLESERARWKDSVNTKLTEMALRISSIQNALKTHASGLNRMDKQIKELELKK